jgi:hypothetical protein
MPRRAPTSIIEQAWYLCGHPKDNWLCLISPYLLLLHTNKYTTNYYADTDYYKYTSAIYRLLLLIQREMLTNIISHAGDEDLIQLILENMQSYDTDFKIYQHVNITLI